MTDDLVMAATECGWSGPCSRQIMRLRYEEDSSDDSLGQNRHPVELVDTTGEAEEKPIVDVIHPPSQLGMYERGIKTKADVLLLRMVLPVPSDHIFIAPSQSGPFWRVVGSI